MGGWTERFSCLNISPSLHAVCAWAFLKEIRSLIAQCYVSSLLLWHNPWQEKHEVGMTSSVSHLWVEHITVGKTQQQGHEMGGHAASAVRRQSWTLVFNLVFFFFPFYIIWDPSSWNGSTHIQVLPPQWTQSRNSLKDMPRGLLVDSRSQNSTININNEKYLTWPLALNRVNMPRDFRPFMSWT